MGCDARAHITGTVWQIRVKPGDVVSRDQELVVLESMKMEMPVVAPCAGKVAQIHVAEGQAVAEGDRLVSLDEVS
jgi:urea carboxylase